MHMYTYIHTCIYIYTCTFAIERELIKRKRRVVHKREDNKVKANEREIKREKNKEINIS